jgi:uncharacterized protein YjbI with pentapeptide repeats
MPHPQFSDDEIKQRAYYLYQARGRRAGDPKADWQEAIDSWSRSDRHSRGGAQPFQVLSSPLAWTEKKAIEPTANWLEQADIFRIIEKVSPIIEAIGIIAIPMAIWWFSETSQEAQEQQEKAVRAQAAVQNYLNQLSDTLSTGKLESEETLQTIVRASTLTLLDNPDLQPNSDLDEEENRRNDRKGQTINYLSETGLIQVKVPEQVQNGSQAEEQKEAVISLANANLSGANLIDVTLSGANLSGANLIDVTLISANLKYADLSNADLSNADLSRASLYGANLVYVNLSDADLSDADLSNANFNFGDAAPLDTDFVSGADLSNANFSGAELYGTNLIAADLSDADLSNADLSNANLRYADLSGADLSNANLSGAFLIDVKGWTEEQLMEAKLCNTELPPNTNLDSDRDCEVLGIPAN